MRREPMANTANTVVEFEGGIAPLTTERTLEEISIDIDQCQWRLRQSVIDIGGLLKEAKLIAKQTGYPGGWRKWAEERHGFQTATADRLIAIHTRFAGKVARIRGTLEELSFSALDLLAQKSTPDEVVETVEKKLENGESVTAKQIKELKDKLNGTEKEAKEKLEKQSAKTKETEGFYKNVCVELEKSREENNRLRDTITSLKHSLDKSKTVESSAIDVTPEQPPQDVIEEVAEQEPETKTRAEGNEKFSEGLVLFDAALDLYEKSLWGAFMDACEDRRIERQGGGL
jgi:hypothetical protein